MNDAVRIFEEAVAAASIPAAFARSFQYDTSEYKQVFVVAIGKAALPMLESLRAKLSRPFAGGVCCAPTLPAEPIAGIAYFTGGHPLPNEDSFRTAHATLALLGTLRREDLVFFLISGGGSAMCELPLDPRITLDHTRVLYQLLVGCGATIAEINTVRKHFSAVKGGRLAAAAGNAARVTLLVSDVAPRFLDALASGPTLEDTSTVAECHALIERFHLRQRMPDAVARFFADPLLPETPRLGPAPVATLLSSDDLLQAAKLTAERLGYVAVIDEHCDDWDYADAARYLLGRFAQLKREHRRICLLSGGEVTVKLGQSHGRGGRNQQFALACALAGLDTGDIVLSAGSDGIDGNSPAAGALVNATTVDRARLLGLDASAALAGFDAWPLFVRLGDVLETGPTHNNLRDLRVLLSA